MNNIKKLLVCGFVSVIGVVSCGRQKVNLNTTEQETNKYFKADKNHIVYSPLKDKVFDKDFENFSVTNNNNVTTTSPVLEDKNSNDESNNKLKDDVLDSEQDDMQNEIVYTFSDGWVSTAVNVRIEPNTDSEILTVYKFNTYVSYAKYNDDWSIVKYGDNYAYIYSKYISNEKCYYRKVSIPSYNNMKTWMPYKAITNKKSQQYKLQQISYTGKYGIRMYDGRYCVAVGTGVTSNVGTYVDLVLANGTVIPCIVGDIKANAHTDSSNLLTKGSNCCSEFIIDKNSINSMAKRMGDFSYACDEWNSRVVEIRVYDIDAI